MEINALLMDEKDNVVTCVTEVPAVRMWSTARATNSVP